MPRIPTVEIEVNGRRKIVNADDPRAQKSDASNELTPEAIDKMKKDDIRDLLDSHEVEYDARKGADDLREMAKAVIFVNL